MRARNWREHTRSSSPLPNSVCQATPTASTPKQHPSMHTGYTSHRTGSTTPNGTRHTPLHDRKHALNNTNSHIAQHKVRCGVHFLTLLGLLRGVGVCGYGCTQKTVDGQFRASDFAPSTAWVTSVLLEWKKKTKNARLGMVANACGATRNRSRSSIRSQMITRLFFDLLARVRSSEHPTRKGPHHPSAAQKAAVRVACVAVEAARAVPLPRGTTSLQSGADASARSETTLHCRPCATAAYGFHEPKGPRIGNAVRAMERWKELG